LLLSAEDEYSNDVVHICCIEDYGVVVYPNSDDAPELLVQGLKGECR
jgi:hypothetical protein